MFTNYLLNERPSSQAHPPGSIEAFLRERAVRERPAHSQVEVAFKSFPATWNSLRCRHLQALEDAYPHKASVWQTSDPSLPQTRTPTDWVRILKVESGLADVAVSVPSAGQDPASRLVMEFKTLRFVQSEPYTPVVRALLGRGDVRGAKRLLELTLALHGPTEDLRGLERLLAPARIVASHRKDRDRTTEFRLIEEEKHRYRGKWVAVLGERVVASAESLKAVLTAVRSMGLEQSPLIQRID